jgi:hypothetical protein
MNVPEDWTEIIGGKRYSTKTATLIADDAYWDGHNWERRGRNRFLYRTQKNNYFLITLTQWQGEKDRLAPINQDDALRFWDELSEKRISFEDAFPGITVEDA